MSRLRDVLMENKWNMFCKSPHMVVKVCLTCHGKRSDWFEKNDNWHQYWGLGTKTGSPWNMMIWSRCTGMIGNLALYLSVLCSWTGNIFISKVEIHHFLRWKCVLFQSLQKANFNPCLTISNLISLEVIPFNSYPKRQKALDKTMFKSKSTSNSLHKAVWWKINICNSDRCTEFDGSGANNQIQWIPREHLKFLKVLHYPMFHKSRTDL